MKYDDASWHSGGEFPAESPKEYGGTHIGIFLRWCFSQGWAGELHTQENADDIEAVISGKMTGTDFLFKNCDGKLTDEDLTDEANAFVAKYYESRYADDYAAFFADQMYVTPESDHDVNKLFRRLDERRNKKPWWKLW